MKNSANEVILCFKNGSFIKVIPANQSVRGNGANNIVILKIEKLLTALLDQKQAMNLFGIKRYRVKRFKRNEYIVDI